MRASICLVAMTVAALFAAHLTAQRLYAGRCFCALCGCEPCEKVCKLVREEKKVTVTCLGFKDEDFCVGGCSECVAQHCEMVCEENCDPEKICSQPKRRVWYEWEPKNPPTIYTKRKLMRKTITKKIPTFKWVVVDLCEECRKQQEQETAELEKESKSGKESKPEKDSTPDKEPKPEKAAKPAKDEAKAAPGKDEKKRDDDNY